MYNKKATEKVKLYEICDIKSGGTPSREKREYWINGEIPWVKIGDFNGKYIDEVEETITYEGLNNSSAKIIEKGSILFTIFATIGEVAILKFDATTNQAIAGITINDSRIEKEYLYYYLKSMKTNINNKGRGVAQNNINLSILKNLEVPIFSLKYQKNIVNILNRIDCIIELKIEQLNNMNEFTKSLFIEMFGDPVENPKKWDIIQLHDRCDIVTGNTPAREKSEYYGNYIEWIKSDNINTDDMYLTVAEEYLSKKGLLVGRCVEAGSILMTCIAGSIGCIGNVGVANRKVAFNQQINAIVTNKDSNIFIYWLMVLSKKYIQGTVNMSLKGILSKGKLSELYFPFPPIELQHKFEKNAIVIDKSKLAVKKSLEELEILKKSLMQKYFA